MKSKAVVDVEAYFNYLKMNDSNSGYAKHTMSAKLGDTHSTGSVNATVPRGIEMTDRSFLIFISRMSTAIEERLREINYSAYKYLILRYQYDVSLSDIHSELKCSERTGRNLHKVALDAVSVYSAG